MNSKNARKKRNGGRISRYLWEDRPDRSWWLEAIVGWLRVVYFVFRGFRQHQCPLRASALTFVTALSIVPVLALSASMLKGMGVDSSLFLRRSDSPRVESSPADSDQPTTGTNHLVWISDDVTSSEILPVLSDEATTPLTAGTSGIEPIPTGRGLLVTVLDAFTRWLTAGQSAVRDQIVQYVEQTNFSRLNAIGILVLVMTAVFALGTMENVFNEIWHVHRARTLLRKFADYLSVIVICPILIVAAMLMTAAIPMNSLMEKVHGSGFMDSAITRIFSLAPYISLWLGLSMLYLFLPNTRVRFRCAMVGGFVAGVIWQFAFWGYTTFQFGFSRYNAIYSALAAIPIFLVWLYLSWLIVLFGAEVAAAYQNRKAYERDRMMPTISPTERMRIGLNLILTICSRFRAEQTPWDSDQLAMYMECPAAQVDEILDDLADAGILTTAGNGGSYTYQPAVPMGNISPARVIEALAESDSAGVVGNATPEAICARTLMDQWREGLWRELGDVGFDRLVDELKNEKSPAPVKAIEPPRNMV